YRKALELDPPEDVRYCLFVNRGLLRFDQGKAEEAVVDLTQAITLKPKQFHAYVSLARIHQKQKKNDQATERLAQAIKLQPPEAIVAECHAELGRTLYRAKKYEAAIGACDESLRIRPNQTVVYGFRGLALLQLKRFEQAARSLDEYVRRGGE